MPHRFVALVALLVFGANAGVMAAPRVAIPLGASSNLFEPSDEIAFEVRLDGFEAGEVELAAHVIDYDKEEVWSHTQTVEVGADGRAKLPVSIGALETGYYEFHVDATAASGEDEAREAAAWRSFGVAAFVDRTAREVREGGYRFGLKKWNWRTPQNGTEWSEDEAVSASVKLGLQWTREMLHQETLLGTVEMIERYPMNVVMKIERFPESMFDEERYGPIEAWEAQHGRGHWKVKTLPQKEPYQAWLREKIEAVPEEQNVFEIWNEAWDKMTPEEFAELSNWIAEVVFEVRPNAILGPNLRGDRGEYMFDARYIAAGGMDRMNMVALHPYGHGEDRTWLLDFHEWIEEEVGRELEIYITEFGSPSTPEGPGARTEQVQAQRVIRQAMALYAGGVEALIPHTMGQSERDPRYLEEWYGFFRFSHEPKPVLMAYVNAARLIDSSRYVGDLWYGPGLESMLFERDGEYTLALGTRGETVTVEVAPGVAEVTVVNMVGRRRQQSVPEGGLRLTVDADWTYLVGVSPDLADEATIEPNPDRWPKPDEKQRNRRSLARMTTPPSFEGNFDEWEDTTQLSMVNPAVHAGDASGVGYLAWDDEHLYVGLHMRDNEVYNAETLPKIYRHDSMELFISMVPREEGGGYGPYDHQLFIAPTSGSGELIITENMDSPDTSVQEDLTDVVRHRVGEGGHGWVAELAIPWSRLGPEDFKPEPGATIALEMRVNDADRSHERFKIDPEDAPGVPYYNPPRWSLLEFEE